MTPFFYDQRRQHSVSTSSSVTWSHAGVTRAQRRELEAEREERELAGALEQEEEGQDDDGQGRDQVLEQADRDRLQLGGRAAQLGGDLRRLLAQGLRQVVL
jgi:hypothetical protein